MSISIGLSITGFLKSLGESVPLSHGISSYFDLARVYLEVQSRPSPDEINGQIGFTSMIPVEEKHKTTGRFGALSPALLRPLNTTLFLQRNGTCLVF